MCSLVLHTKSVGVFHRILIFIVIFILRYLMSENIIFYFILDLQHLTFYNFVNKNLNQGCNFRNEIVGRFSVHTVHY